MPVAHCAWGQCKNDSRKKHLKDVKYFTFPKPVLEDNLHANTIACKTWITMCGRPQDELNLKKIHEDKTRGKYYYRVCCEVCFIYSYVYFYY